MLEEVDRTRTALLGAVSHDLRTPLSAIAAAASELQASDVSFSQAERGVLASTIVEQAARLDRTVANLLDNALRHGPEGTPVEVEAASAGGAVVLTVRDHGPGIGEVAPSRLFTPFQTQGGGHVVHAQLGRVRRRARGVVHEQPVPLVADQCDGDVPAEGLGDPRLLAVRGLTYALPVVGPWSSCSTVTATAHRWRWIRPA